MVQLLRYLPLIAIIFSQTPLLAQSTWPGDTITCWSNTYEEEMFVPPLAGITTGEAQALSSIELDLATEVPEEALGSIEFAAAIWETRLASPVPIRVNVLWQDQGNVNILASAGPTTLFRDFAEAEFSQTWYPVALAEALTGQNLNEDDPDITININSTANWYFGTDGNVPFNQIDLASVVLHELGHGLGFLSSSDTTDLSNDSIPNLGGSLGLGGFPLVYDVFLESLDGVPLTNSSIFNNPSEELLDEFTGGNLFFGSNLIQELNQNVRVELFAPNSFDAGSSISHLDESAFPAGSENALMSPRISRRESILDPGPVTLGIMQEMGWNAQFDVTSVREQFAGQLSVFPNPARTTLQIEWPSDLALNSLAEVQISDSRGAVLQRHTLTVGLTQLSVANLSPGYYTVVLRSATQLFSSPLIILP